MTTKRNFDKNPSKKRRIIQETFCNKSPTPSGTSYDEPSSSTASDEATSLQSSAFNNLLLTMGHCNESACRKRQTKGQGRSDSEEDEDEGSESSGSGGDSPTGLNNTEAKGSEAGKNGVAHIVMRETGLENDTKSSDSEDEDNLENDGKATANDSKSRSSFHTHLSRVLSKMEIDDLMKASWKYKWHMPAFGSLTSKWKGTGESFLETNEGNISYGLKLKLYKHWLDVYEKSRGCDFKSSMQRQFFSLCNSYRDILHCNKKGFYRKSTEDSSVMDAYIMHTLNHVYRTRSLVTKNDSRLVKNQDRNEAEMLHGGGFLDRGFTRPKVLFLLPFRSIVFRVVKRLIQLTPPLHKSNVEYLDRFSTEFGSGDDTVGGKQELFNGAQYDESFKVQKPTKPADFEVLFEGNSSEDFMIGIKLTRRSIKLYSDFYSSDIIIASPVKLVQAIGKAEADKEKDVDYLSSIEVLVVDHADIISMQNWEHMNSVFEQLNRIPSDQHGSDVMRVRTWFLDGHARFYRQTILLSSFLNRDMNVLFNNLCFNYEGKVMLVSDYKSVLPKVLLPVRQVFERFDSSIAEVHDAHFDYFAKKIFPKIKDSIQGGIMIFISCYYDFVRIRNFLKAGNASFCVLGEYTKQSDISRARGWFFEGKRKIMLYTERAHFYHRYKIRGIQNLYFYSLPENKEFYPEIINMLDGAENTSCSVLFSRFDKLRLERIVGSTASKKMLSSEKSMFVFC